MQGNSSDALQWSVYKTVEGVSVLEIASWWNAKVRVHAYKTVQCTMMIENTILCATKVTVPVQKAV